MATLPEYAIQCPLKVEGCLQTLFAQYIPPECRIVSVDGIFKHQNRKCKWRVKIVDLKEQLRTTHTFHALRECLEVYKPRNTNISNMEPTMEEFTYFVEYSIRGCKCHSGFYSMVKKPDIEVNNDVI